MARTLYKFHDPRDGLFVGEPNACAPRALSVVFDLDYETVWGLLSSLGREYGTGTTDTQILSAIREITRNPEAQLSVSRRRYRDGSTRLLTAAQFARHKPKGKYLILVRQHALAVINGALVDNLPRPVSRHYVEAFYPVSES